MPAARLDQLFHALKGQRHVALAVSGGSDSVAMLRLADMWVKGREGSPKLSILTVDHGLRPEAAGEAQRVAEWASALGHDHHVFTWRDPQPVQAKARAARYDLMGGWCEAHGAPWLLTAHTMDDQAETVLMRMARTASLDSLAGIPAIGHWRATSLLRPLLGERHEALRDMLRGLGQAWIEDPSNEDDRFERVRIRKAMPVLAELGITAESLSAIAQRAAEAAGALWSAADDWVAAHVKSFATGHGELRRSAFAEQNGVLQSRILAQLIRRYGSGTIPEPSELEHLTGKIALGSGRWTLGGAIIAGRRDSLLIGREPGRIAAEAVAIPAAGQILWDGRFLVRAEPGSRVLPAFCAQKTPRDKAIPAFVQSALPAVILAGSGLCMPHLGIGAGAEATFQPRRNLALGNRPQATYVGDQA